eukprot:gb/GFBE01020633.1/.p1 GENE.gb/GFBE01020633.1/~~gb/GFBE01020633.1/.p1  ORF type:complete len:559 (+),score=155.45 gb/GFBE01020633.1/:1-1677(+)
MQPACCDIQRTPATAAFAPMPHPPAGVFAKPDATMHLRQAPDILFQIYKRLTAIEQLQLRQAEQHASLHKATTEKLDRKLAELRSVAGPPGVSLDKEKINGTEEVALSVTADRGALREKMEQQLSEAAQWQKIKDANLDEFVDATEAATQTTQKKVSAVEKCRILLQSWQAEILLGVIIMLNMVVMFVQLEWTGWSTAYQLGLTSDDNGFAQSETFFTGCEITFNAIYLLDIVLRLCLLPWGKFKEPLHLFDALVVIACCLESFILSPLGLVDAPQLIYLRFVRTIRVFRAIRVLKFMKSFENLRVLVRTLGSTMDDLAWGMMLLLLIIIASGMLMVNLCQGFILNEQEDQTMRLWLFERFGSSGKAAYTLFEATFTGTWVQSARPLIVDVNPGFAFFWVLYVTIVNFAVIRVIAALFLKQTLAVASEDAEKTARENMKKKEDFARNLRQIFQYADSSGDGLISFEEFHGMIKEPHVLELFMKLQLDLSDVSALFLILADEDGTASYDEFLKGAMAMKATARNLDIVSIKHEIDSVRRDVVKIHEQICLLTKAWCTSL